MNNRTAYLLMILLALVAPQLQAQEPPQENVSSDKTRPKISLDLKGMDVVEVIKLLSTKAGINIIVGKNVAGKVTLFLKEVDVWDAFEIVLFSNDLAYTKKGDIINVMTQRDYELVYGERFVDKKKAKVMKLTHVRAADISRALLQFKTTIGKIVVDEGSNTLILIDTPSKINEMSDFVVNADRPLETKVFALNYAPADKLSSKLQETITKGVGSIKIDERTNKIAITDFPQKIEEISKIIKAFDERTTQVLIDAQIIEINPKKDEFSMGVDWDYWLKKNFHLISSLPAPALASASDISNKLTFGVAATDIDSSPGRVGQYKSVIQALRVIGETKIISSPRIVTLNNQEAKILVGTKDAYITSTTSQSGTGSTITSQTVNFVDVGIKLFVTPTISHDGFVTIKIRPEISSAVRTNLTAQGQITQVPIVTTSEAETTIMIKDGTTIIIAGLKRDNHTKEVRKVPVIGDVPLVGFLFRNTRDEVNQTELVIFLTPHIVTGDESLEYTSNTNDSDILYQQSLLMEQQRKAMNKPESVVEELYKQSIFDLIKSTLSRSPTKLKGKVTVSFVLNRRGYLKQEPVILSSTDLFLNPLTIRNIKKNVPFPPFPEELKKEEEIFRVELSYQ